MSLWSAQSTRIQTQSAFFAALRAGDYAGTEEADLLSAMESENDELLLLRESAKNLELRRLYLESHSRELAGVLGRHQVQALEDLQYDGVEWDLDVMKCVLFGKNLIVSQ